MRGEDRFGNFIPEPTPVVDMDPEAVKFHARANAVSGQVLYRGSEKKPYFTADKETIGGR